MAIIQNGSPLFSGDAGSGPSEIRRYILENDWLDAIVQLSTDQFMNTGIATYIWICSKDKPSYRAGKVQLIDASHCYEPRRKSIGTKRNDMTDRCRELIVQAYGEFEEGVYGDKDGIYCESKIFDSVEFGYNKIVVERPLRYSYTITEDNIGACASAFAPKSGAMWGWDGDEPVGVANPEAVKAFVADVRATVLNKKFLSFNDFEKAMKPLLKKYAISKKAFYFFETWFREEDPSAEVFVNVRTGQKVADTNLRDTENVPLVEDIDAYFAREVLPYAPDAWIDKSKTKVGYEIPMTRYFYEYQAPEASEVILDRIIRLEKEISANLEGILK